MPRTRTLVVTVLSALALAPSVAIAHEGDPNYRSTVTAVEPAVPGVQVEVVNYDDSLVVTNRSRETVVMEGYDEEPYVRISPDGTVEVNRNSAATYLNDERDGSGTVPPSAKRGAEPVWKLVDKTGKYAFHDHRIHWMGAGRPPAVKDPSVQTKAYDWKVPMRVGSTAAVVQGQLLWVPTDGGGPPVAAFVALGLLALAGGVAGVVVRRRRGTNDAPSEAW